MKRLLFSVVIILACKVAAMAQPSLIFPSSAPNEGETFCVDVKVKDFTDILSMQYSLKWDSSVIQFVRVEGFNLPSFSAANFNTSSAVSGKLGIDWQVAPCSTTAVGVTAPDGTVIYRLCFKALAKYGGTSEIILSDDPTPIRVTRVNACPNNIGMFSKNGLVSIGVRPLTLIASKETANEGDLVCVDYSVTGFDDLTSMQFSLQWDPAILDFDDVLVLDNLKNLVKSNFGTPDQPAVGPGKLTLSWSYVDPMNPGVTLADSTKIFQVCFRVLGKCETSSAIEFVDSPTPFEFTNTVVAGYEIKVITDNGRVQVSDCDPTGLKLFADCGAPVNPNDQVCVKISTAGFQNIKEMLYNLEWNENVLQFVDVKSFNGQVVGLDKADFNLGNVSNGVLGLNWSTVNALGVSLPGGSGNLFEVCFKVIGVNGGSPITFTGSPPKVVTFNSPNIGINPSNCAVEIIEPQGVIMNMVSADAPLGDTACVDVRVSNFKQIVDYQFSLAWESNHMSFVGIKNDQVNLPNATVNDFSFIGVDNGALSFTYLPSQPQTITDNTVIFSACFEMVGTPQECDNLEVVNQPIVTKAVNSTSNGNDVGVVAQPAKVCILFPEGFFLDIGETTADTGTVACVPIKVVSFDNITSAQIPFSWEPSAIQFAGVQIPGTLTGLTNASFDTTSANVGLLKMNWTNATPVTVADSAVIFNLCFKLVGIPDSCYGIKVGEPVPLVTTANGNGSLLSDPGEICIRPKLTVVDTIIRAVSCPGTNDGEITLVVSGGRGPLGFTWQTLPAQFGPTARNLSSGLVEVTVFDNSSPALILRDTFEIGLNTNLPFADAGADKDFTCNPPIVQIQGQGSTGANYSYQWRTTNGQLTSDANKLLVGALAPGNYILEVKNNESGCVARDTVLIKQDATNFPTAEAGENKDFSCDADTIKLNGAASSTGANFSYRWRGSNGGTIAAGQDTLQSPNALTPGIFVISVTNRASGCVATDSVTLRNIKVFPNANAGIDTALACGQNAMVELQSRSNNPQDSVAYQWLNLNGEVLSQEVRYQATAVGEYILRVTNPANNCSAIDSVKVLPSSLTPTVQIDSSLQITCLADTVTLAARVTNSTNYAITWTASNGGQFVPGTETSLTPKVAKAGTYQLVVRDTASQCTALDTIAVRENKQLPTAEAGRADSITCQRNSIDLDGSASSRGADFTYAWKLNGNVVASDTLKPKVSTAGTYYLDVTNKLNGCVSVDSVKVEASTSLPQVILPIGGPALSLTCIDSVRTITATVQPANPNYSLVWSTTGGNIVSGQGTLAIRTNKAGTYSLKVTNPANGCESSNESIIEDKKQFPAAKAGTDKEITCTTKTVALSGDGSSVGSDFTYQWKALGSGQAPSPNNALQVTASTAGRYELVVTNTSNSCVSKDTVIVAANDTLPKITFATATPISCKDTVTTLDASATTPTANVTAQWNGLNGSTPTLTNNPLRVSVNKGGDYELVITNNANGCVARDTISVSEAADRPSPKIDSTQLLTCVRNTTTLNAAGSTVQGAFTTQWTALNGGSVQVSANNPLQATATGVGKYQLTITSTANGCKASTEVEVKKDPNEPVASATAAKPTIGCGENTTLNSAGSSSGNGISYRWSVVSGTGTIATPTTASVQVDKAGTYQLVVTNAQNGCTDTTTVSVQFNIQFESANAGADVAACAPNASVTANLPTGTTGQWKSLSGVAITNPTQATINLTNLKTGDNRFVWALTAPGCGEYSADTTNVKVESTPTAANDAFTLKAGETQGTILVTGNDNLNNIANFSVGIVTNPIRGAIGGIGADGKVAYIIKAGVFGQDEFSYKLCSSNCPTYCDTAFVQVLIEEDENFEAPPRNNTITANADGLNDKFIFEELLINPEQYPDNELIIFNRWGDIVFTAAPYNNDWDGTNDTGQNLPEGTYYYILRLDISEGIIIRGDITIVR